MSKMHDFARPECLKNQMPERGYLKGTIATAVIGAAFFGGLIGLLGRIDNSESREEFMQRVKEAPKMEYVMPSFDEKGAKATPLGVCFSEGLDTVQAYECVDYLNELNPQTKGRFIRAGETIFVPDMNGDGKIGR